MYARVRDSNPQRSITSCAGREFVKAAWRPVPAGYEAEAERNPHLETVENPDQLVQPAPEPESGATEPDGAETVTPATEPAEPPTEGGPVETAPQGTKRGGRR